MTGRTRIALGVVATIVLAVGAGVASGSYVVAQDADWTRAADRRIVREEERDAVRADVAQQEQYLREAAASLGADPTPVRDQPIEFPEGTRESVLGGTSAIGDFTDVFIDEGIVLQGVSAEEVDSLPLRPTDTIPPKPKEPITPQSGSRLVKVTLRVTNRSSDGADPGCGIASLFSASAFITSGKRAQIADVYDAIGTYPTSCGSGIADGASADIVMGIGMPTDERLTALQFLSLGDDGKTDDSAPLLVFEKPI